MSNGLQDQLRVADGKVKMLAAWERQFLSDGNQREEALKAFDEAWEELVELQSSLAEHVSESQDACLMCCRLVAAAPNLLQHVMSPDQLISWAQVGLPAAEASGDQRLVGIHYNCIGIGKRSLGRVDEALGALRQSIECAASTRDSVYASALFNLGTVLNMLSRPEQAARCFEEALQVFDDLGDERGARNLLGGLSLMHSHKADYESAREAAEQYLVRARAADDARDVATALGQLGNCCRHLGLLEAALEYERERLEIAIELGAADLQRNAYGHLGSIHADIGDYGQALSYHTEALAISRLLGDERGEAADLANLGDAYHGLQRYQEAVTSGEAALALMQKQPDASHDRIGAVAFNLSHSFEAVGKTPQAVEYAALSHDQWKLASDPRVDKALDRLAELEQRVFKEQRPRTEEDTWLQKMKANPKDQGLRLAYADWLDERGDSRGEMVRLAESTRGAEGTSTSSNEMLRRLHVLAMNVVAYSDVESWIISMGYWNAYQQWQSPLCGETMPEANVGRTDLDAPIAIGDRAAKVLRKRAAELRGEVQTEVVLRVETRDVTAESFACEIRFDTATDDQHDYVFWSNGVRVAMLPDIVDTVRGMELLYYDGAVKASQRDCRRKPQIKDYANTISIHSIDKTHYTRGQSDTEQEIFNKIKLPAEAPKSASLIRVEQMLVGAQGLMCLPRFFREECLKVVRGESDLFLDRYYHDHLHLIEKYIEPLARAGGSGSSRFHELCRALVESPNLGAVSEALGFGDTVELDPNLWLSWAVQRVDDPVVCLYCTASFVAVPPVVGNVPVFIEGMLKALIATNVAAMGRLDWAVEIIESFLQLSAADYESSQSLEEKLNRSPLSELGEIPRTKMVETLANALEGEPHRGKAHAELVRQAACRMSL